MRTLEKNKQKMFYSLYKGIAPIYEYDSDGNKVVDFVDDDGTEYYREIGEKEVFVTVGAGDIDRFVGPIAELLNEKIR